MTSGVSARAAGIGNALSLGTLDTNLL